MQPSSASSSQSPSWRRVGALSSTFSLHVLAIALALLAMTGPRTLPEAARDQPPPLLVELLEHPPLQAPTPPTAAPPPPVAQQVTPKTTPQVAPVSQPISGVSEPEPAAFETIPDATGAVAEPAPPQPAIRAAVAYADVSAPAYPAIARTRGLEGETLLRVLVGTEGQVIKVQLQRGSGHSILDRAALQAVRGWRFHPAMVDGIAREAWIQVPISFRLDRH